MSRGPNKEGKWSIEEVTLRPIKDDELVVEMVASGICTDPKPCEQVLMLTIHIGATDSHFADSPPQEPFWVYPRVVGHEGSGYVKEVGKDVTVAKPGDPVLLSFDCCTKCALCKSGSPSYCLDFNPMNFLGNECFSTSDGKTDIFGRFFGQSSFASLSIVSERSVVNAKDLIKNDDELKLFAPLGCGIQTGSGTVVNVAQAKPDDSIAVIGLGGVGLSAIMAAKLRGVKTIIGIDRMSERIALAKELGATHGVDTTGVDDLSSIVPKVQESTPHNIGPTITIDTTGLSSLVEAGIAFTAPKGRIIQVGTGEGEVKVPMIPFMCSGKTYLGSIEGSSIPRDYVPQMVKWYREGNFPLEKMVKFYKAEDFKKGLEDMQKGADAVKPVIVW